jgi:RimJ/RimL family protein N-acetyltransferase
VSDCPELRTDRLLLRRWRPEDRTAFASLNADPRVTEFLGEPLSTAKSDALVEAIIERFESQGFGFWALELAGSAPFIGMAGLNIPRFDAPFMPAVEVGWRLDPTFWGCGYATEAARAALDFAFTTLGLDEVVGFTAQGNVRSRRVMERLGMHRDPSDDFDHRLVAEGSALRRHVLYRIGRPEAMRAAV